VRRVAGRWFVKDALDDASARILDLVRAHHAQHPLDTGAPRQEIRSKVGADAELFDQLVRDLVERKQLDANGAELRLAGSAPTISTQQQKLLDDLLTTITAAGHEPPSVSELQTRFGPQTVALLKHLERERRVVQVEDNRFYTPDAVRELLRRLETGMAGRGELAPTDLREVLGFSRKYLIPFLEFCDRQGYTSRQGNGRIWRGAKTR
jgi:selenocysteine-specific elongation factor